MSNEQEICECPESSSGDASINLNLLRKGRTMEESSHDQYEAYAGISLSIELERGLRLAAWRACKDSETEVSMGPDEDHSGLWQPQCFRYVSRRRAMIYCV